jgi:hypothetical protein
VETVGEHLEGEARRRWKRSSELDLYGRSAFNRYYYATYLLTRSMLKAFNPAWRAGHKDIPNELTGWVTKDLKKAKEKARAIGDRQAEQMCVLGMHHAHELAVLMKLAYSARVVADYEPEEKVIMDRSKTIKMGQVEMSRAKHWPVEARTYIASISRAWSLVNAP